MNKTNRMRHRTSLLICGWLIWFTAPAQNMLEEGTQWIFEYRSYDLGLPDYTESIESITVGGDTIINSKQYKKVTATKDAPCGTFLKNEFLREDGSAIYRLHKIDSSEHKMLDFDDSLGYEILFNEFGTPPDTAFAITDSFGIELVYDGTPFNVQYMRIINNGTFFDDVVYKVFDGIGFYSNMDLYDTGLLYPTLGVGLCDIFDYITLRCHIQGQDTVRFTEFDCFESSIPDAVWENGISSICLSPNPTSGLVEIPDDLRVERVLNLDGKEQQIGSSDTSVDLEQLEPGIYILILANNSGLSFIGRVVKL